jgi:hypothetical protein
VALPQFTGEEGICSLLEDEIGQVQGLNRWDAFLTAGSRTAHEFYRAWITLQQEAEQCSTFLGKQLEGELAAPPHCDPTKITPGQIVYSRNDGSKHDAGDPLLVIGTEGSKIKVQRILHSHTSSTKSPKITSQKIIADEKFLHVPPYRRNEHIPIRGSADDSWWRKGKRPEPSSQ